MTPELSHPRGSWTAPTSAPLLSLSSQRRTLVCLPSSPPTSVRAQEKSPSSFLGSWFSGRSPWSRRPHPIRPDRPKMGCQGFPRGYLEEGCSDTHLHWGALLYCRGHSHPNPTGYSFPWTSHSCPDAHLLRLCIKASATLAVPSADTQGRPPQACPAGPTLGRTASAMHTALVSLYFSS